MSVIWWKAALEMVVVMTHDAPAKACTMRSLFGPEVSAKHRACGLHPKFLVHSTDCDVLDGVDVKCN